MYFLIADMKIHLKYVNSADVKWMWSRLITVMLLSEFYTCGITFTLQPYSQYSDYYIKILCYVELVQSKMQHFYVSERP
jgi:hypothetical protein